MKHVEIKFNSDNTDEYKKLKLNGELIAEAFSDYQSRKRYIKTDHDKQNFEIRGSWNNPYVIVKAGTIINLDVEDIESLKEELNNFINDDIEVTVKDLTEEEIAKYKEIEALKAETEKIQQETKRIQKLQEELAQARIAKEEAAKEYAEAIKKLNREEEALENAKLEKSEIENDGIKKFVTIEEMKQNNRTHYFVVFNKQITRQTYRKLEALAYLYNGKYHVEDEKRGFYFKSAKSKDNFMNIKSLEMSEEMKEKIAKCERFVALNY